MVVVMAAESFGQILNTGKLAATGSIGEVRPELVQFVGRIGVSLGLRRLCGVMQVRRDMLGDLLILRRVVLLKLLERAQRLGKGGKPAIVRLRRGIEYRSHDNVVAHDAARRIVRLAGAFERVGRCRF